MGITVTKREGNKERKEIEAGNEETKGRSTKDEHQGGHSTGKTGN